MIAIHAHGIPHVFPREVLGEADAAGPATLDHREDWRDVPLVTIDPADAKDHDDAVHAEPDPDPKNPGGHIVTVAIADVSWYVRPGTALDREAVNRGNSVYFPDRVVPMLPERISNDLCSLREGEDRPALAVRMVFSADGRKLNHRFHRVHDALGGEALLPAGPGRLRRRSRRDARAAGRGAGFAVGGVSKPQARPRRARAARTRPAGTQGAARAGRLDRPDRRPRAAGSAPADRGIHDPGERRRGRDAGGAQIAAGLSHPRHALDGQARRRCATSSSRSR